MSGKGLVTPGPTMKARSKVAVEDVELQAALSNLDLRLFTAGVVQAEHPEWKDRVAEIRRETLADLEQAVTERCRVLNREQLKPGTNFHWWPKPIVPT